ncbi:OsmC family protein [Mucilaginibacter mali]|uniref:OsmC family protein n=1 Tax=Mucilaginibacter mali TaxID=2740462 RepID=A0A7D4UJZ0_9SPHI|nr:OsmC family protein [Mucilaginibacter mali]QKJ29802.1 OsmC family protein [Mucilaginibacter mali]
MSEQPEALATARATITHTQYKTVITSGGHTLIADEPEDLGGTDLGMDPEQLLLASLSACTAITMQMYINRKMWVVDEIIINLAMFATETGTLIKSSIDIKGNLNDEQKKRLHHIADVCPVHKILTGEVVVETVLV